MSDLIEPVGARLTLLNGPAFRAGLASATEALQAFNDEQERTAELANATQDAIAAASKKSSAVVVDSSAAAADAVKAEAAVMDDSYVVGTGAGRRWAAAIADANTVVVDSSVEASGAIVAAADRSAAGMSAANTKIAASSTAAAAETKTAWTSAVATSGKILKYASVLGAVVIYEGVKKYMSFQQQMAQLFISAGVPKSQISTFTNMATAVSNATGIAAVSVGDMMYRIASANPKIQMTTQSMKDMVTQAGNLAVLTDVAGNPASPDTVARLYGAIVSNGMSLTRGGPALTYSKAGGENINEWVLGTAGRGDITPGQLVAAMGTGLLPVAKIAGLGLNDIGAALDVLTPAMNAQSASTRLKTAIGMIFAPSAKAMYATELIGGTAPSMAGALRTGGFSGFATYIRGLETKALSGKSFIGAGIFGAKSGKYSGISGAADYLKSLGFTNAALVSLLQTKGISGLKSETSTQLQGQGFNAGTTGAQAAATVFADIFGGMFGGGRTGAAIMQVVNEPGVLANRYATIPAGETPKSYQQKLAVAFSEPIVVFHKFEQQLENLTIRVGKDVTPALDKFMNTLLKIGKWFGNNKGALDALGIAAGTLVAGAAVVKTVSVATKMGTGVVNIGKFLLTGSWTSTGTSLTAAGLKLNAAGITLQAAADRLALGTGVAGGAVLAEEEGGAVTFGTIMAKAAGPIIGIAIAYVVGSYLSKKYSKDVPSWLGWLSDQSLKKDWENIWGTTPKPTKKPRTIASTSVTSPGGYQGQTDLATLPKKPRTVASVTGSPGAFNLGTSPGGFNWQTPPKKPVVGFIATPSALVPPWVANLGKSARHELSHVASDVSVPSWLTGLFGTAAGAQTKPTVAAQPSVLRISPVVSMSPSTISRGAIPGAQQYDLSAASKQYTVTAASLKTAANDQKTAADKTNTSAGAMNTAAQEMLVAARAWQAGAGLISSALSASNIHNLAVAGTKTSVARK